MMIILCLIIFCLKFFVIVLGVFSPLYTPPFFPFLTLMILAILCHICWLACILTYQSLYDSATDLSGSSHLLSLICCLWDSFFLIREFYLSPMNLSWLHSRKCWSMWHPELGLNKRLMYFVFHFCCSGSVLPDGWLALQLAQLRRNNIKASTLTADIQDQLMCNLTPLGVWTLEDLWLCCDLTGRLWECCDLLCVDEQLRLATEWNSNRWAATATCVPERSSGPMLIEGLMANQQLAAQLKSTVLWFERVNVFHRAGKFSKLH